MTYSSSLGKVFIDNSNVCRSTLSSYICAVRRLDDYIDGKEHGRALFQVYDKNCIPVSHSCGPDAEEFADDPTKYIEDHWPEYCVKCFETDSDVPITIYPTKDMINEIYREHNRLDESSVVYRSSYLKIGSEL